MCIFGQKSAPAPARQAVAMPDNAEATRQAGMEARIRRARSGAAANVLTSPDGIPSTTTRKMGSTT
jgi:hypothetical protein